MAKSLITRHEIESLVNMKLSAESEKEMKSKLAKIFDGADIDFNSKEFEDSFKNIVKAFNAVFKEAGADAVDLMPGKDEFKKLGEIACNEFISAWKTVGEKGGMKFNFNTDQLDEVIAKLDIIAKNTAKTTKKSLNKSADEINAAIYRLGEAQEKYEAIKKAIEYDGKGSKPRQSTIERLEKEYNNAQNWEEQYQYLIKYVKTYEKLNDLGSAEFTKGQTDLYKTLSKQVDQARTALSNLLITKEQISAGMAVGGSSTVSINSESLAQEETLKGIKKILEDRLSATNDSKPSERPTSNNNNNVSGKEQPITKSDLEKYVVYRSVDDDERKRATREDAWKNYAAEYWTDSKKMAASYSGAHYGTSYILKGEITPKNPLIIDADGLQWDDFAHMPKLIELFPELVDFMDLKKNPRYDSDSGQKYINERAKQAGFDAVIMKNVQDDYMADQNGDAPISTTIAVLEDGALSIVSAFKEMKDEAGETIFDDNDNKKFSSTEEAIPSFYDVPKHQHTTETPRQNTGAQVAIDESSLKSVLESVTYNVKVEGDNQEDNKIAEAINGLSDKAGTMIAQDETLQQIGTVLNNSKSTSHLQDSVDINPHYLTNESGDLVTAYRGIHNSFSGLVSSFNDGITFFTDSLEVAKDYAGESGKIEKVLLKMKNPLEIDGRGASYSRIEYYGDKNDEISKTLHELAEQRDFLQEVVDGKHKGWTEEEKGAAELKLQQIKEQIKATIKDSKSLYGTHTTDYWAKFAKDNGYDGVVFKNIFDNVTESIKSNVFTAFNQDQIAYIETLGASLEDVINKTDNQSNAEPKVAIDENSLKSVLENITYKISVENDGSEDNKVVDAIKELSDKAGTTIAQDETLKNLIQSSNNAESTSSPTNANPPKVEDATQQNELMRTAIFKELAKYGTFQQARDAGRGKIEFDGQEVQFGKLVSDYFKKVLDASFNPTEFEKLWKEAREQFYTFTPKELTKDEAVDILREKMPENILEGWFRKGDSTYKSKIEELALSDDDIRNAALNIMWDNYKNSTGKSIGFDEFLHSDIPMYRGKNSEKYTAGDETLAFTFDRKVAEKFGKYVLETLIKPIETLGAYQTTGESEALVYRKQLEDRAEYKQWHADMSSKKAQPVRNIDKEISDAEYIIKNANNWLKMLNGLLDEHAFDRTGKKDATDSLKLRKEALTDYYANPTLYSAESYAEEKRVVAWSRAFQEALRQNVAQSTLDKNSVYLPKGKYEESLATLKEQREYWTKVLAEKTSKLSALKKEKGADGDVATETSKPSNKAAQTEQNENKKTAVTYEELTQKVNEYYNARKRAEELIDKKQAADILPAMGKVKDAEKEISKYFNGKDNNIADVLKADNATAESSLEYIAKALGVKIPQSAQATETAIAGVNEELKKQQQINNADNAQDEAAETNDETAAIVQQNEELKKNNVLKREANNIPNADTTDGVSEKELAGVSQLETKINNVVKAVRAKTDAFTQEELTVRNSVGKEISALIHLKQAVADVTQAVGDKTNKIINDRTTTEEAIQSELTSFNSLAEKVTSVKTSLEGIFDNIQSGKTDISDGLNNITVNVNHAAEEPIKTDNSSGKKEATETTAQRNARSTQRINVHAAKIYSTLKNMQSQKDAVSELTSLNGAVAKENTLAKILKNVEDINSKTMKGAPIGHRIDATNDLEKKADKLGQLEAKYEISGSLELKEQIEQLDEYIRAKEISLEMTQQEIDSIEERRSKAHTNELAKSTAAEDEKTRLKTVHDLERLYRQLGMAEGEFAATGETSYSLLQNIEFIKEEIAEKKKLIDVNKYLGEQFDKIQNDSKNQTIASISQKRLQSWDDEFIALQKKYKELGELEAQAEVLGGSERQVEVEQLKKIIEAEYEKLELNKKQHAERVKLLDTTREEAKAKERELQLAKQHDKQEKKTLQEQMRDKRREARDSKMTSTYNKGDDTLGSLWRMEDISIDDLKELSDVKKLQAAIEALKKTQNDVKAKIKDGKDLTIADNDEIKKGIGDVTRYSEAIKKLIKNYEFFSGDNSEDLKRTLSPGEDIRKQLIEAANAFHNTKIKVQQYDAETQQLTYTIQSGDNEFTSYTAGIRNVDKALRTVRETTTQTETIFETLKRKTKDVLTYFTGASVVYKGVEELRRGIQYVREIDVALTELKKVTDETEESYAKFLETASKTADKVGSTIARIVSSTADFARLGYDMKDAANLAESASVLMNVSEFSSIDDATSALISTMQAFGYTADESMHVVDVMNIIGNNFAVSTDGLAVALQDSASALMSANNSYQEAAAMVAAANKVVQNPSEVGGALRTISLRLRGTKVSELEGMGEDTTGAVETQSKLRAKLKGLTGVDILTDSGAYKSTYEILLDISKVWDNLTDENKAGALELIAGKNRANVASALLSNTKDLEKAYETAMGAEGSALKENEEYLDSIQGKIDQFTNAYQTVWNNLLKSEAIKFIVDLGTKVLKLVSAFGELRSVIFLVLMYFNMSKKYSFDLATWFFGPKDVNGILKSLSKIKSAIESIRNAWHKTKPLALPMPKLPPSVDGGATPALPAPSPKPLLPSGTGGALTLSSDRSITALKKQSKALSEVEKKYHQVGIQIANASEQAENFAKVNFFSKLLGWLKDAISWVDKLFQNLKKLYYQHKNYAFWTDENGKVHKGKVRKGKINHAKSQEPKSWRSRRKTKTTTGDIEPYQHSNVAGVANSRRRSSNKNNRMFLLPNGTSNALITGANNALTTPVNFNNQQDADKDTAKRANRFSQIWNNHIDRLRNSIARFQMDITAIWDNHIVRLKDSIKRTSEQFKNLKNLISKVFTSNKAAKNTTGSAGGLVPLQSDNITQLTKLERKCKNVSAQFDKMKAKAQEFSKTKFFDGLISGIKSFLTWLKQASSKLDKLWQNLKESYYKRKNYSFWTDESGKVRRGKIYREKRKSKRQSGTTKQYKQTDSTTDITYNGKEAASSANLLSGDNNQLLLLPPGTTTQLTQVEQQCKNVNVQLDNMKSKTNGFARTNPFSNLINGVKSLITLLAKIPSMFDKLTQNIKRAYYKHKKYAFWTDENGKVHRTESKSPEDWKTSFRARKRVKDETEAIKQRRRIGQSTAITVNRRQNNKDDQPFLLPPGTSTQLTQLEQQCKNVGTQFDNMKFKAKEFSKVSFFDKIVNSVKSLLNWLKQVPSKFAALGESLKKAYYKHKNYAFWTDENGKVHRSESQEAGNWRTDWWAKRKARRTTEAQSQHRPLLKTTAVDIKRRHTVKIEKENLLQSKETPFQTKRSFYDKKSMSGDQSRIKRITEFASKQLNDIKKNSKLKGFFDGIVKIAKTAFNKIKSFIDKLSFANIKKPDKNVGAQPNMSSFFQKAANPKEELRVDNIAGFTQEIDKLKKMDNAGIVKYIQSVNDLGDAATNTQKATAAYAASVTDGNYSVQAGAAFVDAHNAKVKESGVAAKAAAIGHAALNAALSMGLSVLIQFAMEGLGKLKEYLANTINPTKKLAEDISNLKSNIEDTESEISSINNKLDECRDRMAELIALPSLSFTEQEELNNLEKEIALLERKLKLEEALLARQETQLITDSEQYIDEAWDDQGKYYVDSQGRIKDDSGWNGFWHNSKTTTDILNDSMKKYQSNEDAIANAEDLLLNWDNSTIWQRNDIYQSLGKNGGILFSGIWDNKESFEKAIQDAKATNAEVAQSIESVFSDQSYAGLSYGMSDDIDKFLDEFYTYQNKWNVVLGTANKSDSISSLFDKTATTEMQSLGKQLEDIVNDESLSIDQQNDKIKETIDNIDLEDSAYRRLKITMDEVGVTAQDIADYFTLETGIFDSNTVEGITAQYAQASKVMEAFKSMGSNGVFTIDGTSFNWNDFFTKDSEGQLKARADKFAEILKGVDNDTRKAFMNIVQTAANSAEDLSQIDWDKAFSNLTFSGLDKTLELLNSEFETLNNEMFAGAADDINGLIDTVSELQAALEDVAGTMDLVHSAQTQMNHSGRISVKTALELMKSTEDWDSILEITNGTIKLRDNAEQHLIQTELTSIQTQLYYAWTTAQTKYETALAAQGELDYANNSGVVMTAESIKAEAIGRVSAVVVALGAAMDELMAGNWGSVFSAFGDTYKTATATVVADAQQYTKTIGEYKTEADKAKKLYDAASQVTNSVSDFKDNWDDDKEDAISDEWDNLVKKYENELALITNERDLIEAQIDQIEATGGQASSEYYKDLIRNSGEEKTLLEEKKEALEEYLEANKDNVDQDTWTDMNNEINATAAAIKECTTNLLEYYNTLEEIDSHYFEQAMDDVSRLGEEIEFVQGLLEDEDVVDENGDWTEAGITRLGLYVSEMERAAQSAEQYKQKLNNVDASWTAYQGLLDAAGGDVSKISTEDLNNLYDTYGVVITSQEEYKEKTDECNDAIRNEIEAQNAAREGIIQTNEARIDAIKEGIEKEIEAYEDYIDVVQDALNAERD